MTNGPTDLVLACLDDIRSGRRSLDECVEFYPDIARELRSLAPLARELRFAETAALETHAKLRVRQQLLGAIASNGHHPAEDRRLFGGLRRLQFRPRWLAALSGALAALAAGGAVVYAAQGAPPESPLYPVRTAVQVVARVVTPPRPTATVPPSVQPSSSPSKVDTLVLPPPRVPAPTPSVGVVRAGESAPPGLQRRPSEADRDRERGRQPSPTVTPAALPARANEGGNGNQRNPEEEGNARGQARSSTQGRSGDHEQGSSQGADQRPGPAPGGDERRTHATATPGAPPRGEAADGANGGRGGGDARPFLALRDEQRDQRPRH